MSVTITPYNHTAAKFANGSFAEGDNYKLMLCTSAVFDPANIVLDEISKTETTDDFGYLAGGQLLTGVAVVTVGSNDAKFDADDVVWTASAASITASKAILYNSTDLNYPPVAFIDFGGSQSATDGTDFRVIWNVDGIFNFTVA